LLTSFRRGKLFIPFSYYTRLMEPVHRQS